MDKLIGILKNLGKFTDEEIKVTTSNLNIHQLEKGEILEKEGSFSNKIYFISEGFLRTYQLIDGNDKTISFGKPKQFIAPSFGLGIGVPSEENIESISTAEVISLDAEKLEYLKHSIPKISFLMNIMYKEILDCKESRIKNFINLNSTERYRFFVENHPEIMQVVSINHLASYLGVAPETISRIRSKIIF